MTVGGWLFILFCLGRALLKRDGMMLIWNGALYMLAYPVCYISIEGLPWHGAAAFQMIGVGFITILAGVCCYINSGYEFKN